MHAVEDGIEEEVAVEELALGEVEVEQVVEEMYRRGLQRILMVRCPRAHLFGGPFSTLSSSLQIYCGVHGGLL